MSKSKITSKQLAEKSDYNFCTGCVEVEFASRQKARHELFAVSASVVVRFLVYGKCLALDRRLLQS